jgi:hypothetical protein
MGLHFGELAMNSRAKRRLTLRIAATIAVAFAALTAKPLYGCNAATNCPSNTSNIDGVAANALPTYPEPATATEEPASEPIKLKKFTRPQTRTARRAPSRKATPSQRAGAAEHALRKAKEAEHDEREAPVQTTPLQARAEKQIPPAMANANAELVVPDAAQTPTAEASEPAPPAAAETQARPAEPPTVELVSADEFNDLDRAARETNQMPRLMKLTASDSRAELRDDDSKWAQTSTIGKLFVAFGALLMIGSAVRMFLV